MNKKFLKRVVAFAMAATMVVGNGAIAFAEGSDGIGTYEGTYKIPEYVAVTLPTQAANHQFDYVADPDGLIADFAGTGSEKNGYEISGTDTGVYFATGTSLKNTSEPIEVENKNYMGAYVDAEMTVKNAGSESIAFATGSTWAGGYTAKELYLALQDAGDAANNFDYVKANGSAKISVLLPDNHSNFVTGFSTESAAVAWGEKRNYFYTPSATPTWTTGGFQLYGAINKNATWQSNDLAVPDISVTWSVAQAAEATVTATAGGVITVAGLTKDQNFKSIDIADIRSSDHNDLAQFGNFEQDLSEYDETNGGAIEFTLGDGWKYYNDKACKVTLYTTDGAKKETIVTFSIA